MSLEKDVQSTQISISGAEPENTDDIIVHIPTQTRTSSLSSQMQLISLAKQFALDGGLIAAEKQIPLEERVLKRDRLSQLRKQKNLETIILKAINYCSSNEIPDRADHDWFNSFTIFAENVSNKIMQDLWAKILAGEISKPGSFSIKTLKTFQELSISDAKLFSKVCALAVKDNAAKNIRIISGSYQTPGLFNFLNKNRVKKINLNQFGLSYSEILILTENNLIFHQEAESNPLAKNEQLHFNYNGNAITFTAIKAHCLLNFYKFTPTGAELAHMIADKPNNNYIDTLKSQLSDDFKITGI